MLIVNGQAYPVNKGSNGFQRINIEARETGIVNHKTDGTVSSVTGYECRHKGIKHWRTLTYNREKNVVMITDKMCAEEAFNGKLLWHIAHGIEIEMGKNTIQFHRGKVYTAEAIVDANVPYQVEVITNEDCFPYVPWLFDGESENKPALASLLAVDFSGRAGENVVHFSINLV